MPGSGVFIPSSVGLNESTSMSSASFLKRFDFLDFTTLVNPTPKIVALSGIPGSALIANMSSAINVSGSVASFDTTNNVVLLPAGGYAVTIESQTVNTSAVATSIYSVSVYQRVGDSALNDVSKLFTSERSHVVTLRSPQVSDLGSGSSTFFFAADSDFQLFFRLTLSNTSNLSSATFDIAKIY